MLAYVGLLEPKKLALGLLKSTFNAENFTYRLSWSIFRHFVAIRSWNVCCSSQKSRKIHLSPFWGVQGRSRSSRLIKLKSTWPVLVMSVPTCNRFHTRKANSGKITFLRGYASLTPSFKGNPPLMGTKFCCDKL